MPESLADAYPKQQASLADAYPKQQARLRELIGSFESLRRADEAAATGDVVAMLRCYLEMEASE